MSCSSELGDAALTAAPGDIVTSGRDWVREVRWVTLFAETASERDSTLMIEAIWRRDCDQTATWVGIGKIQSCCADKPWLRVDDTT